MMSQDNEHPEIPLSPEVRPLLASRNTMHLALGNAARDQAQGFHDYCTNSSSVLSNTMEGGLKKDLTPYLLSNGNVPARVAGAGNLLGVNDADNLVGPANAADAANFGVNFARYRQRLVSPKFGLLRTWANLAATTRFANPTRAQILPKTEPRPGPMSDSYDYTNPKPVAIKEMDRTALVPILTEGSIYYNISYFDKGEMPGNPNRYGLRLHIYPRAVLWNPYNVSIQVRPSALSLFINGAKTFEVLTADTRQSKEVFQMNIGRPGAQRGTLLFTLPSMTLAPGQCQVLSPPAAQPYNRLAPSNNALVVNQGPDVNRFFYFDAIQHGASVFSHILPAPGDPSAWPSNGKALPGGNLPAVPVEFREVALNKFYSTEQRFQADDYRMMWKDTGNSPQWTDNDFDELPMTQFVSCALQYGDNDELPVIWSERNTVPIEATGLGLPTGLFLPPDRRTRDGFRFRWFNEHTSNRQGAGSLANTPVFDNAPIANWNVRSAYSIRSPWENLTDSTPAFFGIYTRDLFDDAVSWNSMQPALQSGGASGFPFGQPIEGPGTYILFDLPRSPTGVVSPGAFQHVKLSEYIWHPSHAFGNSLVDPRVGRLGTEVERRSLNNRANGGWNRYAIGWADDGRSDNSDQWAQYARDLLQNVVSDRPGDEQTVSYDLSFELNHQFWDRYFLSAGNPSTWAAFASNPSENPLPNGRLIPFYGSTASLSSALGDLHLAAGSLMVHGAFNINSTRKDAWKAMLLSTRDTVSVGRSAFSRLLNPPGSDASASSPDSFDSWAGFRSLTDPEIDELAESIVTEVKTRGPFLSMGDFVNRRLRDDVTGDKGTLQAAIDRTSLNRSYAAVHPLDNSRELPDYYHRDNIADPTRMKQRLMPDSTAWGMPGYLTQADLLQVLSPGLVARSDTFTIRTYGESKDGNGTVMARAWCEAVVQRVPHPLNPDALGLNPQDSNSGNDFGRRFITLAFRWLAKSEI